MVAVRVRVSVSKSETLEDGEMLAANVYLRGLANERKDLRV